MTERERVYAFVSKIPRGRVIGYGALGACLDPPVGARQVGRAMAHCPQNLPWWRVVGADGSLPLGRGNPHGASLQVEFLEGEGVSFTRGGRVVMAAHAWEPPEDALS